MARTPKLGGGVWGHYRVKRFIWRNVRFCRAEEE